MGIGYYLCPATMQGGEILGARNLIGLFLVKAGGALIDNTAILFAIRKWNLKTPGREDDDIEAEKKVELASDDYTAIAKTILEGCGGKENITSIDNCVTRLRLEVKDITAVNDKVIKSAGVAGVIKPGKTSVQVIIGTKVQFVADAFSRLCE